MGAIRHIVVVTLGFRSAAARQRLDCNSYCCRWFCRMASVDEQKTLSRHYWKICKHETVVSAFNLKP